MADNGPSMNKQTKETKKKKICFPKKCILQDFPQGVWNTMTARILHIHGTVIFAWVNLIFCAKYYIFTRCLMERDGNIDRGRCVPCRTEKDCKQDGQVKSYIFCVWIMGVWDNSFLLRFALGTSSACTGQVAPWGRSSRIAKVYFL